MKQIFYDDGTEVINAAAHRIDHVFYAVDSGVGLEHVDDESGCPMSAVSLDPFVPQR